MKLLELVRRLKPQYQPDWYHETIAGYLGRLLAGDSAVPNLLISSPPGSGKTELVSSPGDFVNADSLLRVSISPAEWFG